jgi:uncharacterized membrane protein
MHKGSMLTTGTGAPLLIRRLLLGAFVLTAAAFVAVPISFRDKLDLLAAGVCAQRPAHSYYLGEVQLPLEARMGGIFAGFLVAVVLVLALGRDRAGLLPPRPLQMLLFGLIGVMGLDGTNALLYDLGLTALYPPQNALRLVTGLLCGFALALLALPVLAATLWRDWDAGPSVASVPELLGGVGLLALVQLATMSGAAALFYPVALVMAGGLVASFAVGNGYALALLVPLARRATGWREASTPLLGGVLITFYELLALAAFRFWSESALGVRWPV